MTWTWLGILAALFLVLTGFSAYRRGFIREVIGISFLFLTIFLVWVINPYVNQFLKTQTTVYDRIEKVCEEGIQEYTGSDGGTSAEKEESLIAGLPFPNFIKEGMAENNTYEVYQYFQVDSLNGYLAGYLATAIVNGISFMISYLVAFVLLRIGMFALGLVGELPGIRIVNRMAGLLLGIVKGIIVIWLLLLVITIFCGTEMGGNLLEQVEKDFFLNFLYEKDIFVRVFMSIFYS